MLRTRLSRLASTAAIGIGLIATPALADIVNINNPVPTIPISRHLVETESVDSSVKNYVKWLTGRPERKDARLPMTVTGTRPVTPTTEGSIWDRLAACESGGDWSYNGSSGFDGGLQFLPSTWRAAGGTKYAPYAYLASREQQITVAKSWLARTSWAQWPVCSRRIGAR